MRLNYSNWKALSDARVCEIVSQQYVHCEGPKQLYDADAPLYAQVVKRNLIDDLFPSKQKHIDWQPLTNEHLLEIVRQHHGKTPMELQKEDVGLYQLLVRRKITRLAFPERKKNNKWDSLDDAHLLEIVSQAYSDVVLPTQLRKKDAPLFAQLERRELLDAAFPERSLGAYSRWTVEMIRAEVAKCGYQNRGQLYKGNRRLYSQVMRNCWIDKLFPHKRIINDYRTMTFAEFKKQVKDVKNMDDLVKQFGSGLYKKAERMGWNHIIPRAIVHRDLQSWDLARFVQEVREKAYVSRSTLMRCDGSLHAKALKKGWLDVVFPKKLGSLDGILQDYVEGDV